MDREDKIISSPDILNPVDFFNRNCVQYAFDLLSKVKNVRVTGRNSLTYITNRADDNKRMIVVHDDGNFEATMKNGLDMPVGEKWTAFMMLQKFIFKNSFSTALSHVIIECMNNKSNYIRVGTKYLQKIIKKDRYGINRTELKIWDKYTIIDDHGKDALSSVEKFYDFTMIPSNTSYEHQIDGNYNLYAPFEHEPVGKEKYKSTENWRWIKQLMEHIFGKDDGTDIEAYMRDEIEIKNSENHYAQGIKYMKVLYEHPRQVLPILVLTSEERQTGKSTFVDFLNILFGANTVVINPNDISSSFNEPYATKNIIMIEESRFDSVQATEKLKNLATQKKISVNAKFIQQYSLPFFGKLIITSNDEQKFSKVDDKEIRYWVRKIPELDKSKSNHNILDDMAKEIPYFLEYLKQLPKPDLMKSRMVFLPEEISTKALETVKRESRPEAVKEIELYLEDHCIQNLDIKTFYFTAIQLKRQFFDKNSKISSAYINKLLKTEFKLEKLEKTKRYIPFETRALSSTQMAGKPYVYHNKFFGENIIGDDDEPKVPF